MDFISYNKSINRFFNYEEDYYNKIYKLANVEYDDDNKVYLLIKDISDDVHLSLGYLCNGIVYELFRRDPHDHKYIIAKAKKEWSSIEAWATSVLYNHRYKFNPKSDEHIYREVEEKKWKNEEEGDTSSIKRDDILYSVFIKGDKALIYVYIEARDEMNNYEKDKLLAKLNNDSLINNTTNRLNNIIINAQAVLNVGLLLYIYYLNK